MYNDGDDGDDGDVVGVGFTWSRIVNTCNAGGGRWRENDNKVGANNEILAPFLTSSAWTKLQTLQCSHQLPVSLD